MSSSATKKLSSLPDEELQGPSRIEEQPPQVARTLGVFGLVVLLASALMVGWNALRSALGSERLPFFGVGWIRLWTVLGFALIYVHASFDRSLEVRRGYMISSWIALILGGLGGLAWIIQGMWGTIAALTVAILVGLVTLAVTVSPWVSASPTENEAAEAKSSESSIQAASISDRTDSQSAEVASGSSLLWRWLGHGGQFLLRWNNLIGTNPAVTRVTFGAAAITVLAIISAGILTIRFRWESLPIAALGASLAGMFFLVTSAKYEINVTWRQAASATLALAGAVAFLLLLAIVVRDFVSMNDAGLVAPVGLLSGLLALLFLLAQVNLSGTDDDLTYYSAVTCLIIGGCLVGALALVRSLLPPLSFYLSDTWRPSPYFIPNGLLTVMLAVLQIVVGLVAVSNNQMVAILRRELLAYFYTPAAYLVLAALSVLAAFQYLTWMSILLTGASDFRYREMLMEPVIRVYFYGILPVFALLAIPPFLTMRLFSEEKRSGTLEVLLAAPLSETTVVIGKFLGAWVFFLVAWGTWFVFPLIFRFLMGHPFDYHPLLSFYLGTAFMAMSFLAIGVFFSALTENQVIAAVLSYAGIFAMFFPQLLHWLLTFRGGAGEWIGKVIKEIAILEQYESFLFGKMYLQHLLYHVSIAVFFLFLTVRILESRKWK